MAERHVDLAFLSPHPFPVPLRFSGGPARSRALRSSPSVCFPLHRRVYLRCVHDEDAYVSQVLTCVVVATV